MSELRVRSVDQHELDGAEELLCGLTQGDEARMSLSRLGGVEEKSLAFGDGWAASIELDGTTLLVHGGPAGAGAGWTIFGRPGAEGGAHAAHKLQALIGLEPQR